MVFHEEVIHKIYQLITVGIVEFFCGLTVTYLWTMTIKRQTYRMNIELFQSILKRNMAYFDTNSMKEFHDNLFDNIRKIETGIGFELLILFTSFIFIFGGFFVSFFINWRLTLIILSIFPVVIVSSMIFSKLMIREATNEINSYSVAAHIAAEVFGSLRTVLSLNAINFEQKRYERALKATNSSTIRQGVFLGIYTGFLNVLMYVTFGIGFIAGSFLTRNKNNDRTIVSDVLAIVFILADCMCQFGRRGPFLQSYAAARSAAMPIFRLIDEEKNSNINEQQFYLDDISLKSLNDSITGNVTFNNVTFAYPSRIDRRALDNITFTARVNEQTALVGASGCGKSTCMSLLLRLYEPSSGEITIGNRPLEDYHLKQLRQTIGIVSQEPFLFCTTIYENIRHGKANATKSEIEEAARQANAHDFIMNLPERYETRVGEGGIQLSGGEKQRIALARALVKQPKILLLDEATSALDHTNEKIVQEALDRACQHRTTIVIAHRLNTIRNADQIYVFQNGKIIENGTHGNLMNIENGEYQSLVRTQQMEIIHNDEQVDTSEVNKSVSMPTKQMSEHFQTISQLKENTEGSKYPSVFLRLLSMNRSEWMIISIGCFVCVCSGIAEPLFALLVTRILQTFAKCEYIARNQQILIHSAVILLLGLLVWFLRYCQYRAFAISGAKLTERIRLKAFQCFLRQEIAYFDQPENNSGNICKRLSTDAALTQEMTGTRLGVICECVTLFCSILIFGCLFNWKLMVTIFLPNMMLWILFYFHAYLHKRINTKRSIVLGQTSSFASEVILNIRTVKQLAIENEVIHQYSELIQQIAKITRNSSILNSIEFCISWILEIFIIALMFWCALNLFEKQQIASNQIAMIAAFTIILEQALKTFMMMASRLGGSLSSAEMFFTLFDRKPQIDNLSTAGTTLNDCNGEIVFSDISFAYPARPTSMIFNKFNLAIQPGQSVALVGVSGSGKSTTIQLLERFYDVTHGQILLDGVDIRELNIQWLRSCFGVVRQEPVLFDLTIAENISYGLENVSFDEIMNAAIKANIHSFIEQLPEGYETNVGLKGCLLSGGEKQRIAIARILVRRPRILLLDEATSAMDSYNERIIQRVLDQAHKEDSDQTSLIIAQRLSTIRSCDLIFVLDHGQVLENGTHRDLLERLGVYYQMLTHKKRSIS